MYMCKYKTFAGRVCTAGEIVCTRYGGRIGFFYMQGQLRYGVKTAREARKQGNEENKRNKEKIRGLFFFI